MTPTAQTRMVALCLAPFLLIGAAISVEPEADRTHQIAEAVNPEQQSEAEASMRVQYLEIVTPNVDETCAAGQGHGVELNQPVPELGNARTADLAGGGRIGVRVPCDRKARCPPIPARGRHRSGRQSRQGRGRGNRHATDADPRPRHLLDLHPRRHRARPLAELIGARESLRGKTNGLGACRGHLAKKSG